MGRRYDRRTNVPHWLALARIGAVPIIMGLTRLHQSVDNALPWAATLFALASFTDFLDGYLARRWNLSSVLGAFLDTTADKLLVFGSLLALTSIGRASVWAALIIVMREIVVMSLRGLAAMSGVLVKPSIFGKIKATVQFVAIFLTFVRFGPELGPMYLDQWAMWVAVLITIASGWHYVVAFWHVVRGAQNPANA